MNNQELMETVNEHIEILRLNIDAFEANRISNVTAATNPTTPKVAWKLLIFREALMWRILELASGALREIEYGNALTGIVASRSVQECAAACHFFTRKLEICFGKDSAIGLDDTAMKLLLGSRWEDWEYESVNVLTMVDSVDKTISGFRKSYDSLSEYLHPNYTGVALCFSKHLSKFDIEFGSYPRGKGEHLLKATSSLLGSLTLFEHEYNKSADLMPSVVSICTRDLETNLIDD